MPASVLCDKINQYLFEFDEGLVTEYQMAHLIAGVVYGWLKDTPEPKGEESATSGPYHPKRSGSNDPNKC
jgi:hypothetical protein